MFSSASCDLFNKLEESRESFCVKNVAASSAADWSIRDGALQHATGAFFSVVGVEAGAGEPGKVLMYQPQAAITGLLRAKIDGELAFLLQARAEPGCLNGAQYGPTVQSTPANFTRLHGGKATPYIEVLIQYHPDVSIIDDSTQLDLGERYLGKSKRSILAESTHLLDEQDSYIWASANAVCDSTRKSAFLNLDLRSILAISDWSPHARADALSPKAAEVRRSLEAEIRPATVGAVVSALKANATCLPRFCALERLKNWVFTENGLEERQPVQNFSVKFFEVSAPFREVPRWVQPLVDSSSQGEVVLACRERDGTLEFFVTVAAETGLATGAALLPSWVRYPGARNDPPHWLADATPCIETIESDEGGRFFCDDSRFRIVKCDTGPADGDAGYWLRLPELKHFLRLSNVCSIQLRAIVSHLLGVETL